MTDTVLDERHAIGANNPPEPTPFEVSRDRIDELMMESRNWLDGEPITEQRQADEVKKLLDLLRAEFKVADERRKAEVAPLDVKRAEIQARWNTLTGDNKTSGKGKAVLAAEIAKQALLPFEKAAAAERERIAAEKRAEADRKEREARLALQLAASTDLQAREDAEALARDAQRSQGAARKAENARSATTGSGRALSVVSKPVATVSEITEFAEFLFRDHHETFKAAMAVAAQDLATAGLRSIPGVTITMVDSVR